MAELNKVSIPIASPARTKLDLSCDHYTTMSFGQFQPVHYRHPLKGEVLNLDALGTVRPFPLAAPTYGRMRLNMHHFFVPWRVVFPQYEHFYNDNLAVNYGNVSLIDEAPFFRNDSVVALYVSSSSPYASVLSSWSTGDPYDFMDASGNHYRFTSRGKDFYKLLCSLGYEINWDPKDNVKLSALPILAMTKIYIDWYANQSYLDSADVLAIRELLSYNNPVTPLEVTAYHLAVIMDLCRYCVYSPDYYVGSWDNPFAPNSAQYSAISFQDITMTPGYAGGSVDNTWSPNGTPVMKQASAASDNIGSQFLHDALKVITDYSKRHQLAGASNINRTLAQFGMGVEALKLDRSIHIGGHSIDVKTGAVFSTANTASAGNPSTLGDFAGNGFGNGKSSAHFVVDEMGIEITLASILPSGGLFQGMDENNMHIKKHDFFTPEFDGLAVQIMPKRAVYVSKNALFGRDSSNAVQYDSAFAFTGRYGEYKRPRSWVSGDLRCPTRYNGGDSWHLMRQFDDASFSNDIMNVVHSLDFTRYIDNDSYRRIFTMTQGDYDLFICEFHFDVHSHAPCHGLWENYEFESEGNKRVTLESNGSIVN